MSFFSVGENVVFMFADALTSKTAAIPTPAAMLIAIISHLLLQRSEIDPADL
jgi:hypothetical protein